MRNILITTIFCLTYMFGYSQISFVKENLPEYLVQNGDTIGIVLTIEQVQKLDNNSELLTAFKKLSLKCDTLDTYYVQVINKSNEKIALLEVKVKNLTDQNQKKDDMILTLKGQVLNKEMQLTLCEKQRSNDSIIIIGLKKDLFKSKVKNVAGWTTTGVTAAVAIFLGIFFGTR